MNFRTFLTRLAEADARFVVVGGVAASLYGSPRVTFDIDVVPDMDPTNWSRIVDAVWAAGGRPRIPENLAVIRDLENVRRWIEEKGMLALSFRSAEGLAEIDLVVAEADRYPELVARASTVELDGRTFHVAALDDLIDMKRRAGRPQDMLDIEVLEELRSRGV